MKLKIPRRESSKESEYGDLKFVVVVSVIVLLMLYVIPFEKTTSYQATVYSIQSENKEVRLSFYRNDSNKLESIPIQDEDIKNIVKGDKVTVTEIKYINDSIKYQVSK